MANDVATYVIKFLSDASKVLDDFQKVETSVGKFMGKINETGDRLKSFGRDAALIGTVIEAPFALGIKSASDFEHAFGQVMTIMGKPSQAEVERLRLGIRDLSMTMGQDLLTSTRAVYDALSSGVPSDNLLSFVEQASQTAIAGATTTDTAVRVLTATVNAYGDKLSHLGDFSDRARYVSDILFQTVNYGVVTFEELAASMGDVVSTAALANVSLEELGAMYASVTLKGINAAESTTAINMMLLSLISPSKDAADAMEALGIEYEAFQQGNISLAEVMQQIIEKAGSSATALSQVFPNVRAFKSGATIAAESGKNFSLMLERMTTSAGSTASAFEIMASKSKKSFSELKETGRSVLLELGDALLPTVQQGADAASEALQKLVHWMRENETATTAFAVAGSATGAALLGIGTSAIFIGGALNGLYTVFKTLQVVAITPLIAGMKMLVGTAVVAGASFTGVALIFASLGIAIAGTTVMVYKAYNAWKDLQKAQEQQRESELRLQNAIDDTVIKLQKRGVEIDKQKMREMDVDQQREYLAQREKARQDEELSHYVKTLVGKREDYADWMDHHTKLSRTMRHAEMLMLNESISMEEAARVAVMDGYDEQKNALLKANAEETDTILKNLGVRDRARGAAHSADLQRLEEEIQKTQNAHATQEQLARAQELMRQQDLTERQAAIAVVGDYTQAQIDALTKIGEAEAEAFDSHYANHEQMKSLFEEQKALNVDMLGQRIDMVTADLELTKANAREKEQIWRLMYAQEIDIATATIAVKGNLSEREKQLLLEGVTYKELMSMRERGITEGDLALFESHTKRRIEIEAEYEKQVKWTHENKIKMIEEIVRQYELEAATRADQGKILQAMADEEINIETATLLVKGDLAEVEKQMLLDGVSYRELINKRTQDLDTAAIASEEERIQQKIRMHQEYMQEQNLDEVQKKRIIDLTLQQHQLETATAEERAAILDLSLQKEIDIATATLLVKGGLNEQQKALMLDGATFHDAMMQTQIAATQAATVAEEESLATRSNKWSEYAANLEKELADINAAREELMVRMRTQGAEEQTIAQETQQTYVELTESRKRLMDELEKVHAQFVKTRAQQAAEEAGIDIALAKEVIDARAAMAKADDEYSRHGAEFIQALVKQNEVFGASWEALESDQRTALEAMVGKLQSAGLDTESIMEALKGKVKAATSEIHTDYMKLAPSTPGSPAPLAVMLQDFETIGGALGTLSQGTYSALQYMHNMWLGFANSISGIAQGIYNAYQWINPWARHSPSLVESVTTAAQKMEEVWEERAENMAKKFIKKHRDMLDAIQELGGVRASLFRDASGKIDPTQSRFLAGKDGKTLEDFGYTMRDYIEYLDDKLEVGEAALRAEGMTQDEIRRELGYQGGQVRAPSGTAMDAINELITRMLREQAEREEQRAARNNEATDRTSESLFTLEQSIQDTTSTLTRFQDSVAETVDRVADAVEAAEDRLYDPISSEYDPLADARRRAREEAAQAIEEEGGGVIAGGGDVLRESPMERRERERREDERDQRIEDALDAILEENRQRNEEAQAAYLRQLAGMRIREAAAGDADLTWQLEKNPWRDPEMSLDKIIENLLYSGTEGEEDRLKLGTAEFQNLLREMFGLEPIAADASDSLAGVVEVLKDLGSAADALAMPFDRPTQDDLDALEEDAQSQSSQRGMIAGGRSYPRGPIGDMMRQRDRDRFRQRSQRRRGPGPGPGGPGRFPQEKPDIGYDPDVVLPTPPDSRLSNDDARTNGKRQKLWQRLNSIIGADKNLERVLKNTSREKIVDAVVAGAGSLAAAMAMDDASLLSILDSSLEMLAPIHSLEDSLALFRYRSGSAGASGGMESSVGMSSSGLQGMRSADLTGSTLFSAPTTPETVSLPSSPEPVETYGGLAGGERGGGGGMININIENVPDRETLVALIKEVEALDARMQTRS